MPVIVPLHPDTLLSPDTLLHPDGVWIDTAWGLTLSLSASDVAPAEPLVDVVVAARATSVLVTVRLTEGSVPERSTTMVVA